MESVCYFRLSGRNGVGDIYLNPINEGFHDVEAYMFAKHAALQWQDRTPSGSLQSNRGTYCS